MPFEKINKVSDRIIHHYLPYEYRKQMQYNCAIEIWPEEKFYEYFTRIGKEMVLQQPDGTTKPVEGWYNIDFLMDKEFNMLFHCVAVVFNENWIKTLIHELVHIKQFDKCGELGHHKLEMKYKNNRPADPFEKVAIEIAEREYKKWL